MFLVPYYIIHILWIVLHMINQLNTLHVRKKINMTLVYFISHHYHHPENQEFFVVAAVVVMVVVVVVGGGEGEAGGGGGAYIHGHSSNKDDNSINRLHTN